MPIGILRMFATALQCGPIPVCVPGKRSEGSIRKFPRFSGFGTYRRSHARTPLQQPVLRGFSRSVKQDSEASTASGGVRRSRTLPDGVYRCFAFRNPAYRETNFVSLTILCAIAARSPQIIDEKPLYRPFRIHMAQNNLNASGKYENVFSYLFLLKSYR
jgi:hypothetical protein